MSEFTPRVTHCRVSETLGLKCVDLFLSLGKMSPRLTSVQKDGQYRAPSTSLTESDCLVLLFPGILLICSPQSLQAV